GKSKGDGQYTIDGHVDDLFLLLEHLGLKSAAPAGLSMGGYILLRALERDLGRFSALILSDTKSKVDPNEGLISGAENIKFVKAKGAAPFADAFIPGVFAPQSIEKKLPGVELVRSMIAAQSPEGIAGNLLAMAGRPNTGGVLARISVPTLLLCGALDK